MTRILGAAAAIILVLAVVALGVLRLGDDPPSVRGQAPAGGVDFTGLGELPPGPSTGAFSPDGTRLAVLGATGVSVLERDGTLRRLTDRGANIAAFAWMPDGKRIVVVEGPSSTGRLTLLNADEPGGFNAPLDTPWSVDAHAALAVSSDGRTVAIVATDRTAVGGERSTDVVLVELLTGRSTRLVDPGDEHDPHFAGDDDVLVVGEEGGVVVVEDDGVRRRLGAGRPTGVLLEGGYVAVVTGTRLEAIPVFGGPPSLLATLGAATEAVDVHPGGGVALVRRTFDTPDGRVTRLELLPLSPVRSTGEAGPGR